MSTAQLEQTEIELPPLAAGCKPLPEENGDWPNFPYFFRRFPGGIGQVERYLNRMPSRLTLLNLSYDALGTPILLLASKAEA